MYSMQPLTFEDNISGILSKLNYGQQVNDFFIENIGSVYFEMTQNEVNALNELIKLVYYHGIIEDIFDLKLVLKKVPRLETED